MLVEFPRPLSFYHVIPDFEFRAKKVKYTLKNVKRFVKIST